MGASRSASNPRAATAMTLARQRFGLIPVRSPLLGESRLISTPRGTKMFQFPRFPRRTYGFSAPSQGMTPGALPHSDIPGSTPAGGSPRLIAAYHVLHRLLAPRHPPCALCCAAPAPSRTRHTPDLAQFYRLCTCSGTGPRDPGSHLGLVGPRDDPTRVRWSRRPTRHPPVVGRWAVDL